MDAPQAANGVLYANPNYLFATGCDGQIQRWDPERININSNEAHRFAIFVWRSNLPNLFPDLNLGTSGPAHIGNTLTLQQRKKF